MIVISTNALPQAILDKVMTVCQTLNIKSSKPLKSMPAQRPYICRVACDVDLQF